MLNFNKMIITTEMILKEILILKLILIHYTIIKVQLKMVIKIILVIPQPNIVCIFFLVCFGVLLSPKNSDNQEHTNNTENTYTHTTNI